MACRFTLTQRVVSHRVSNFHTPFRHDISSTHSLPYLHIASRYGYHSNIRRKMFTFQIISMIKISKKLQKHVQITFMIKTSKEAHILPKLTADDKASSENASCSTHAQCRNFQIQIFSVAKARCWNTRLSPKTPKVFPVLSSSSKIQFLG